MSKIEEYLLTPENSVNYLNSIEDNIENISSIIETILLTSEVPINNAALISAFDNQISENTLTQSIQALQKQWSNRGLELLEVEKGWRFQTRPQYQLYINKFHPTVIPRYSRAVWETLTAIAYRQPITRLEIEEIRGVSVSSHVLKTLQSRGWIDIIGHKNVLGHPLLYATTYQFLSDFSLNSLVDLPKLEQVGTFLESFHDVPSEK